MKHALRKRVNPRKKSSLIFTLILITTLLLIAQIPYQTAAVKINKKNSEIASVTLEPVKDNDLSEHYPTTSYGTLTFLTIGAYVPAGTTYRYRPILQFDLSSIPSGSTITSAKLRLTKCCEVGGPGGNFYVYVYRLTNNWDETHSSWRYKETGVLWAHPGGDYSGYYGSFYVTSGVAYGTHFEVDVTNLVKKWVDGTYPNYGILLRSSVESSATTNWIKFASKEYSDSDWRPKLIIEYTPPVTPTITLTPTPVSRSVEQGSSTSYLVSVTATAVSGDIGLTVSGLPSGATYSFTSNNQPAPYTSTLTISTSGTTPTGTYTLTITGAGGGVTGTAHVTLEVTAPAVTPDFSIDVSPNSQTVSPGNSVDYSVSVNPSPIFSNPVSLTVSGLPSGATYSFTSNNQVPGFTSTLSISTSSSTPTGTYTLTVTGSSGSLTHSETVTLVVSPAADFSISVTPPNLAVKAGERANFAVTITHIGGFSSSTQILISVEGLPSDASPSLSSFTTTSTGRHGYLRIATGSTTGTFPLTIIATGGGKTHTAAVTLTITPGGATPTASPTASPSAPPTASPTASPSPTPSPGAFDFTLTLSPSSSEIFQGEVATFVVQASLVSGTAQPLTLTVSGLPSDATYTFNPPTVTPTGTSTLTVTAGSSTGSFTFVITASGGGLTKTVTGSLKISTKKCIIATATYGSELSSEVMFLRKFRNNLILKTYSGKQFYKVFDAFYYSFSPQVAQFILEHPQIKPLMKALLYPLMASLHVSALTQPLFSLNPELGTITAGLIASALIGLLYLTPLLIALSFIVRGWNWKTRKLVLVFATASLTSFVTLVSGTILSIDYLTMLSSAVFVVSTMLLTPSTFLIGLLKINNKVRNL